MMSLKMVEKYSRIVQALPADWAPGGEFVPTDFTRKVLTFSFLPSHSHLWCKVAYFLKKYGENSKTAEGEDIDVGDEEGVDVKEEGAMMEIGEEDNEKEEKVVAGKEEGMLEKMIGDYGPQQEVFRKRRSNPPSTA